VLVPEPELALVLVPEPELAMVLVPELELAMVLVQVPELRKQQPNHPQMLLLSPKLIAFFSSFCPPPRKI
jgi:hypothetical protein